MKLEKITNIPDSSRHRRYEDACGTAHALDLLGERWALLVVRELMFGPKRFSDLRADLSGISANVLTQRLEGLEEFGIVARRRLPPPASVQVYELTPWGLEIRPIIETMGRWAARSPHHDPSMPISSVALMSSFRTMFAPERAEGIDASFGVRFDRKSFVIRITEREIAISREEFDAADVTFTGTPAALGAAVYGGQKLETLAAAGDLSVVGNRSLAERFLTLFPLPPKV